MSIENYAHISSNGKTFDFHSNNESLILSMYFQTVILMAVFYYANIQERRWRIAKNKETNNWQNAKIKWRNK